jgi:hypothetical protein
MEYFILGILFGNYVMPILDSLGSIIMTWCEAVKGKLAIKVAESNHAISLIGEEEQPPVYQIGFQAPNVEEEEYEED